MDQETPQEAAEAPTQVRENLYKSLSVCAYMYMFQIQSCFFLFVCFFQTSSLLLLNDSPAPPAEVNKINKNTKSVGSHLLQLMIVEHLLIYFVPVLKQNCFNLSLFSGSSFRGCV